VTARILDGKALAERLTAAMRAEAAALAEAGTPPRIDLIRVGEDPASVLYVRTKARLSGDLGIVSKVHAVDAAAGQAHVEALIDRLNADPAVHGILLQLPLPQDYDAASLLVRLDPDKDVDGLHPMNAGRLCLGLPGFVPCTPLGIRVLLEESGIEVSGKIVAVIGRSALVGRPLANLLSLRGRGGDATVVLCHTRTPNLREIVRMADIVIAAAGKAGTVHGSMLKPGAVVIDVGTNRVPDPTAKSGTRLVGDVDFPSAVEVAGAITPVPGGVGPMTVAMLMRNTLEAARRAAGRRGERRGERP
jgi:methylenetetrahydrofolate dehydrogenase (NADP+)/methenyltetrahydrofolate cyclohydrolase